MSKVMSFVTVLGLAGGLLASEAYAQRGMGDPEGVARQAVQPEVVTLSGTLVEVQTTECQATTGRFGTGLHLILKTPEGKRLNVHLGPAAFVEDMVKPLSSGQELTVKAFRTARMPEDQYVAQALTFGDTTLEFRDEFLRPFWAGGPGRGWGARPGPGMGPGGGRGYGRGPGYGRGGQWY